MQADWLKSELEKPGRSQSALARFMGVVPEIVNRMANGKRQIKAHEADQIRQYMAATSGSGSATLPHISPRPSAASLLTVRGTVEAGSWREVAFTDFEHEPETLPAPRSIVDSGAFALRVAGPSMDQLYPDGSYVVVQPWHGGPLPFGKRVVVERSRPDGLAETTVKELVRGADGEAELWPRSNHPAHQSPVPYKDIEDVTVRIVGVVVWSMKPEA
jgi:phage repressor protein C with HTH and peptisase S24 domain